MQTLAVLADPNRRRIVEILARGERSAGELGRHFKMTQPALSQHLKVLRGAGLVEARADAQRRIYKLRREAFQDLQQWLDGIARFWENELDALERDLDRRRRRDE